MVQGGLGMGWLRYVPNLGGLAPGCTPTWGMPAKRMRTPRSGLSPLHHSHVPPSPILPASPSATPPRGSMAFSVSGHCCPQTGPQ